MTVFNNTMDTATPAGSDDPAEADDRVREIKAAVQERENVDHYWPLTGTEVSDADVGEHRKLTIRTLSADEVAALSATKAYLYRLVTDGELYFKDASDNTIQLTDIGNQLPNDTFLTGTNEADDGSVDLIKAGRNVADDADVALLPDSTRLATNAAPVEDTDLPNKLYVDSRRPYIKLVDAKPTTTNGGTFTAGTWLKRTVAEETDTGSNVSVSSSVIVLEAGTYECRIFCPAFDVDQNQARLRNTTAGTTILVGTSANANSGSNTSDGSFIVGRFTIAASQNVEIQHQCQTEHGTNGFGAANGFGEDEIYTIAEFWKI